MPYEQKKALEEAEKIELRNKHIFLAARQKMQPMDRILSIEETLYDYSRGERDSVFSPAPTEPAVSADPSHND